MTKPRVWEKVGSQTVLAEKYGKKLVTQKFRNPHTGKEEEYSLFGQKDWSVILPVTDSNEVIAVEQYKQGCDRIVLELPAGTMERGDETDAVTATRELLEETGFCAASVIDLGPPQFISTRNSWTQFSMFLGLGCKETDAPVQDASEAICVKRIPLDDWIRLCLEELVEPSAIVATFRSLRHLGYSFNPKKIIQDRRRATMSQDEVVRGQLGENLRFYADMRFKQLTLLMAGMTLAGAGIAQDCTITGAITMKALVAVFALFFSAVMWIMEVRSTLYWVATRERVPDLWPRPLYGSMQWVNSTNALLLLHVLVYFGWLWLTYELEHSCWLLIGLGIGAFLIFFSFRSYWPLWSHKESNDTVS